MLVLDTSSPFGCSLLNKLLLVYEVPRGSITAWIEHNSVKSRNVLSNEAANLYVGSKKTGYKSRAGPGAGSKIPGEVWCQHPALPRKFPGFLTPSDFSATTEVWDKRS